MILLHCPHCDEDKAPEEFHKNNRRPCGRASWCKACVNDRRRNSPGARERDNRLARERRLKDYPTTIARERELRTGLTQGEWDALVTHQGGRCGLCRRPITPSLKVAVDHDHRTGEIRGIICAVRCNYQLLGQFNDDALLFQRAADYLEYPPTRDCWEGEPRWWPDSPGAEGFDLRETS